MKPAAILAQLTENEIVDAADQHRIQDFEQHKPFSLHWELRLMLYLGVTLFSTGLGILVYEHIDIIGHGVIIALIGLISMACFYYAFRYRKSFSWELVESDSPFADYALLLGCLTFLTMEGYLQYQYTIFGNRYGLAAFIPAVLFLGCAYVFDHRGVLSMGITALASWVGLTVSPLDVVKNDFNNQSLALTAVLLGIVLVAVGWWSDTQQRKKHFAFTYFLLGGNLALFAASAQLIDHTEYLYVLPIAGLVYLLIWYARRTHSFLFLLLGVLYGYVALTYLIFHKADAAIFIWIGQLYFLASAGMVVYFFLNYKKILGVKN